MSAIPRIAFIGAGQMAEALIGGLLKAGLCPPDHLMASDPVPARREVIEHRFGVPTTSDNRTVCDGADVIVLAVKPQALGHAAAAIAPGVAGKLIISIAAGVPLRRLAELLPSSVRLVRVMPNAPALIGDGMSAVSLGPGVTEHDTRLVRMLFEAVGRVVVVDEAHMDAVTGLSGSGPAYAFACLEAMADGGVHMGLPRGVAEVLAAQTLVGAARMVLGTGEHPGRLKDRVASPGGTTIAGLHALERGGLRAALIAAVDAATRRSRELGS
jgi:pyrroline-5-carboxylate reductase